MIEAEPTDPSLTGSITSGKGRTSADMSTNIRHRALFLWLRPQYKFNI
jgi:hypothetical protein